MATWCRNRSTCRGGTVIDPRLAWFAAGATCSAVLFGWPWHPRHSRYSRMQDPDWRRSFSHENTNPPSGPPPLKLRRRGSNPPPPGRKPAPPPPPGMRRIYYDMPATIAECGGPCASCGPKACDCGALWLDVPWEEGSTQRGNGHGGPTTPKPGIIPKPQFPSPQKIREDFLP
jgi:hypothetical protein